MPTTYAIPDGRVAMAATLYTGTGATASISNAVNGVSFQPDFVWAKARSSAESHRLADSVRGATKVLYSNLTNAEATEATGITAFASNGFTLGSGTPNGSGITYVGWQWKAGGTAVSNTAGSITSSVSANTTAGFSVVTYTGNGTAGATIGHGLGVAPSMVIAKNRSTGGSAAYEWTVYHVSLGATKAIFLNDTGAAATDAGYWYNTAPTSSVVTVPSNTRTNVNGSNFVFYCFAPVAGYSAFGSYTGNGSADGPFVYCGFRPRYVMLKRSDTGGANYNWFCYDSARDTYNATQNYLEINLASTEQLASVDFLSNGFKVRTSSTYWNASGGTFIYMAFAENPLKFANAR
jgi:hypothetical protein